ncbi:MAG: type III ribulose-bisphosphate carboxylase [Candidatus Aenigmatarchaeota archaeon]|nr:MAG: type III ribulose-bisphosphate carboxylase [Candidatus Aenigmarchaeota archaeon]
MPHIDLKYKPGEDLICEFYLEPAKGLSIRKASEQVAAESSTGTWTKVFTEKPYMEKFAARVFSIKGRQVKIAYPLALFEPGNIPQILSSVAGNIFGMKSVRNLRLVDIHIPKGLAKVFKGPKFGIQGVRNILGVKERPLVGTIVKPKLGLETEDHAKVAYKAWVGGCDIVKDDENLSNQGFNPFLKRIIKTLEMRKKAEEETGEKKVYMPNVTAETEEMLRRMKFVEDNGGKYAMVDLITCGFSSLQTLRERDFNLVLHAHRAMHAAFTRNKKHGISMMVVAKLARLAGVDQIHVGTVIGKMEGGKEVIGIAEWLRNEFHDLKTVFPVCSGGLHPAHIPKLIEMLGKDIVIQAGGGIHGHRMGTEAGAKAMRQAVDSVVENIAIKEYAKDRKELGIALKQWKC